MSKNEDERRKAALENKQKARRKLHLRGFGGNSFPPTRREMPNEVAERALRNLAHAAASSETA